MKISVIIPCYNQAQTLGESIESVLNQKRKADEIFVINDGSTDGTSAIAKNYPVKLVEQVNKGLSSARNTGIMNATGDYVVPLDSDDVMLEDYLKRIEEVAKETDADIIAPSFKEFGVRDTEIILMENPTIQDFKEANRIPYFSAIKREALLEVGGYSPKMVWGWEDWHIWFNLLSRGKKLVTIPEILVKYRTKPQSMIHVANAHGWELGEQIRKDFPNV